MILNKKPLTLADVTEYVKDKKVGEPLTNYLKEFGKVSKDRSDKLKEEIIALKNPKIREENIVKAIDFLPKDKEEINKIFLENGLTDEEANAILKIIKDN